LSRRLPLARLALLARLARASRPSALTTACAAGAFVAISTLSATEASASPLIDALGPVGGEGGANGVVSGASASSTYFNPALLLDAGEDLLVGYGAIAEQIGVTLDGRPRGDVPSIVSGRDILGADGVPIANDTVPTEWLRSGCVGGTGAGDCPPPGFGKRPRQAQGSSQKTRTYLALGIVKHVVPDRFSIGMYALLPFSGFTSARSFYVDEREALFSNSLHPELYGDRLTSLSFAFGAAFKILPTLSLGASVSLGFTNSAGASTYVRDSTNYDQLLLNDSIKTQLEVSPTLGVRWLPTPWLRIGGTLHAPERFVVDTTISATLPSGTESSTSRHDVYDYMPWTAVFGAEADVAKHGAWSMKLVASVKYAMWSSYEDRHGQRPASEDPALAWKDTLTVAIGTRQHFGDARAWLDLRYVPSPVPDQVGRTNYVDNTRIGLVAGVDLKTNLVQTRLRPGLAFFVDRLIPRHATKDDSRLVDELPDGAVFGSTHDPVPGAKGLQTNNPGWPGFGSRGWVYGATVTLSMPL
jgi:hypothetical protein